MTIMMAGEDDTKRFYVGNLFPQVTDKDLESLFGKFGHVDKVEVKTKMDVSGNPMTTFAFVTLANLPQEKVAQCIQQYNNLKWKMHTIKVQQAQEPFLQRLKREREENAQKSSPKSEKSPLKKTQTSDNYEPLDLIKTRSTISSSLKRPEKALLESQETMFQKASGTFGKKTSNVTVSFEEQEEQQLIRSNRLTQVDRKRVYCSSSDEDETEKVLKKAEKRTKKEVVKVQKNEKVSKSEVKKAKKADKEIKGDVVEDQKSKLELKKAKKAQKGIEVDVDEAEKVSKSEVKQAKKAKKGIEGGACEVEKAEKRTKRRGVETKKADKRTEKEVVDDKKGEKIKENVVVEVKKAEKTKRKHYYSSSEEEEEEGPSNNNKGNILSKLESFNSGFWKDSDNEEEEIEVETSQNVANAKRLASLKQRQMDRQRGLDQVKSSIQKSLESKKINFESENEEEKTDLFAHDDDDDDSSDDDGGFEIRPQFEGDSGQKLLGLQSRFGHDDRFKIDQRFADDKKAKISTVIKKSKDEKDKKMFKDASKLRYDPLQSDHTKHLLAEKKPEDSSESEPEEMDVKREEEKDKYWMSDKFSSQLSDEKKEGFQFGFGQGDFSLLSKFGKEPEEYETREISSKPKKHDWMETDPFKYDSSSEEEEEQVEEEKQEDVEDFARKLREKASDCVTEPLFGSGLDVQEGIHLVGKSDVDWDEMRKTFEEKRRPVLRTIMKRKMKRAAKKQEMNFGQQQQKKRFGKRGQQGRNNFKSKY